MTLFFSDGFVPNSGAWEWDVTAGNPEQKAPGSTKVLSSDLIAADPQEWLGAPPGVLARTYIM